MIFLQYSSRRRGQTGGEKEDDLEQAGFEPRHDFNQLRHKATQSSCFYVPLLSFLERAYF